MSLSGATSDFLAPKDAVYSLNFRLHASRKEVADTTSIECKVRPYFTSRTSQSAKSMSVDLYNTSHGGLALQLLYGMELYTSGEHYESYSSTLSCQVGATTN